jgi:hypothetical protein
MRSSPSAPVIGRSSSAANEGDGGPSSPARRSCHSGPDRSRGQAPNGVHRSIGVLDASHYTDAVIRDG